MVKWVLFGVHIGIFQLGPVDPALRRDRYAVLAAMAEHGEKALDAGAPEVRGGRRIGLILHSDPYTQV